MSYISFCINQGLLSKVNDLDLDRIVGSLHTAYSTVVEDDSKLHQNSIWLIYSNFPFVFQAIYKED